MRGGEWLGASCDSEARSSRRAAPTVSTDSLHLASPATSLPARVRSADSPPLRHSHASSPPRSLSAQTLPQEDPALAKPPEDRVVVKAQPTGPVRPSSDPREPEAMREPLLSERVQHDAEDPDFFRFPSGAKRLDVNSYASRKSAVSSVMNLALFTSNAVQLRGVVQTEGRHPYYALLILLISTSLLLQVLLGLLLLYLGRSRIDAHSAEEGRVGGRRSANGRAAAANNASLFLVFLLTIVNVFAAAFALHGQPEMDLPHGGGDQ